jgi:arylamine N-acetyltransferase
MKNIDKIYIYFSSFIVLSSQCSSLSLMTLSLSAHFNSNNNNNNRRYITNKKLTSKLSSSTTTTTMTDVSLPLSLSERYFRRLHIDPTTLDTEPTLKKLQILMEAHLLYIPFENIAQHGGGGIRTGSSSSTSSTSTSNDDTNDNNNDDDSYKHRQIIDIHTVAMNVLDNNRGGFCLELNTLFTYWLQTELYYPIHFVSADVARDDPTDVTDTTSNKRKVFSNVETHIIPFCTTIDDMYIQQYMIDIAFGEPSIHPLVYPSINIVQITPDNMISKFIRTSYQQYQYNNSNDNNNDGEYVMLLWYINNEWVPRLRWNYNDSIMNNTTGNNNKNTNNKSVLEQVVQYQCMYDHVHDIQSGFAQKLIITKLSRDIKISFAGTKLKTTGPPRFPLLSLQQQHQLPSSLTITTPIEVEQQVQDIESVLVPVPVTVQYYDNDDTIRQMLLDVFGIPISVTSSIKFVTGKSSTADPLLWDQF